MGLFFLTSFSVSLLLAYKNATDFCILILYPATLLSSFISSNHFLVESLGLSTYSIMSPANNDSFSSSFPIWIPFISSSFLITMARSSSTLLKGDRKGENRYLFLVLDSKGNIYRFCSLSMMLAVALSYIAFIILRFPVTPFC